MHPDLAEYGPVQFQGDPNALYDRPLVSIYAIDPDLATPGERYEAVARSLRDVLALRRLRTKKAHYQKNAKHAYYLSMEFLIGRSLASNVSNLLLDPAMREACQKKTSTGMNCWTRSRMRDWEMAALEGWLRALSNPWLSGSCPEWAMACGTNTVSFGRRFRTAGRGKSRITGCAGLIHGKFRLGHIVEVKLSCSFQIQGGLLVTVPGKPSTLPGIPLIVRSSDMAAEPSTRCGSGPRERPIRSTSISSAMVISWAPHGNPGRRIDDARAVPGRLHVAGPGASLPAGILSVRLFNTRHHSAFSGQQRRLESAA